MSPTFDAFVRSWPWAPFLTLSLALAGLVYARGWRALNRRDPDRWPRFQPIAFGSGIASVFLALASPIEPFAALFLQVHMFQHLLLMMVAPPLFWLGAPIFPMLKGLPRSVRALWAVPLARSRWLRSIFDSLTRPVTAWFLFALATWLWHVPPVYELALSSDGWHRLQHACFLGAGLLFWYPVVRPYPSRHEGSRWLVIPYLLLADVQNTLLAAVLTFAERPLYPFYVNRPRLENLTALADQQAAGVLMWVPGSLVYLVPLFVIGVRLLSGLSEYPRRRDAIYPVRAAGPAGRPPALVLLPVIAPPNRRPEPETTRFDLLRAPALGRFLRWRHARRALQIPLLALAGLIIYDGLRGPAQGAMNLAGALPWIHWRGLAVLGLLSAGNVVCMACPFTLPRTLAARWLPRGLTWPKSLRNKWMALLLLVAFFWAYEALALWDSPWLTAWIIVAYFAVALAVDGVFRGASFCKYVCPIGQFNFVQSLISPLEVQARDAGVCSSCTTRDCIRGNDHAPGCGLGLSLPRKSSNMDCTFCLDCIHACPHDNVAISASMPAAALWRDPRRSGIGRFGSRLDLAALVVVLVFTAFTNAAFMTGPVLDWQDWLATAAGPQLADRARMALYLAALVVWPLAMVAAAAAWRPAWRRPLSNRLETAIAYSYALVPLGFAMWLAHYGFHLATSYLTVIPITERFLMDHGWLAAGSPDWAGACCAVAPGWLLRAQILALDFGLLMSLYTGYRIALERETPRKRAIAALAPWAVLMIVLFCLGIWILFQPMQMRGTMQ